MHAYTKLVFVNCESRSSHTLHAVLHNHHQHRPQASLDMQTGAGQSLVTRALVISLLNRIKASQFSAQHADMFNMDSTACSRHSVMLHLLLIDEL